MAITRTKLNAIFEKAADGWAISLQQVNQEWDQCKFSIREDQPGTEYFVEYDGEREDLVVLVEE